MWFAMIELSMYSIGLLTRHLCIHSPKLFHLLTSTQPFTVGFFIITCFLKNKIPDEFTDTELRTEFPFRIKGVGASEVSPTPSMDNAANAPIFTGSLGQAQHACPNKAHQSKH